VSARPEGEDQHAIIGQLSKEFRERKQDEYAGHRAVYGTIPPKTDQIITWKDKPTSKVEGPTVRMMCAYNPPAIPAKKPLKQKARSLYRVVLIPDALTASSSSRIACNMIPVLESVIFHMTNVDTSIVTAVI
jgi:hypothetical protein